MTRAVARPDAGPARRTDRADEAPAASPLDDREPIPFRRPAAVVVVHAVGFGGQRELLEFARAMETNETLSEVSLTRVTADEAWFAVRAASADAAAQAIVQFAGFHIRATVDQNLVEAQVTALTPVVTPEPVRPAAPKTAPALERERDVEPAAGNPTAGDDDGLLPARPRFRVFRAAPEEPAAVPPTPASEGTPHVPPPSPTPMATAAIAHTPPVPAPPASVAPPRPAVPPPAPQARPASPIPAAPPAPASVTPPAPPAPAPRRAVLDDAEVAEEEFVNPEARPGGAVMTTEHLTLVVYPFHSFAALNEFQAAIRSVHGVKNSKVRRFYRGTLHLAVDYEDIIPLVDRLSGLKDFDFEVVSESRSELELVLKDSGSLVAAGER